MSAKKDHLVFLAIGAAIAALISASFCLSLFTGPEFFIEDRLITPAGLSGETVILAIDNESIERLGQWPWPRKTFAEAFDKLNRAKPKAVAFDVILAEKSRLGEKDDESLALSLKRAAFPIIFPAEGENLNLTGDKASVSGLLAPLRIFTDAKNIHLGHVNLIIDRDNVVRSFPPFVYYDGNPTPSFAVAAAQKAGYEISTSFPDKTERIVFGGGTGSVRRMPFYRVLADGAESLSGKIVFIGATSPDLHDEKATPLSGGTAMPGVEIQANITEMLLSGKRLVPVSDWLSVAMFFLLAFFISIFFLKFSSPFKALAAGIALGILVTVSAFVLFERGYAVNVFHLSLSWILSSAALFSYRYLITERNRRELRSIFGKYVSPTVLEEILKDPSSVVLGGEERTITVLFSDIRGFTTLSEKLRPADLVRVLNKHFSAMTEEIIKSGGVLDKYIGDAIMAFWGAPVSDRLQAANALSAGKNMLLRLKNLNEELSKTERVKIDIGIGIYTGPAVVGNIGSKERFDYTAIGDTVNVASRLEGLNKEYKTQIIVGETTKSMLPDTSGLKEMGFAHVKGRGEPIKIYTLVKNSGDTPV